MNALPQSDSRCFDAAATEATALCERHRSRLVGFCTAQMGSREEAEDAVQDTFIYALRALRRGIVPECETAWLFTIARNVCSSRRRNGSRRSRLVVTRDLDALQDVIPGRERQRDELFGLPEALAAIPETQRQAILLREWQGLTYAEIAETLDLSKSAVETLLFRARRSLARALEHAGRTAVRVLNVSPVLGFVRSLLEGGAAKVVAGTLAVVAAGTIGGAGVPTGTPANAADSRGVVRPLARTQAAPRALPPPARGSAKHVAPPRSRWTRPARHDPAPVPSGRAAAPRTGPAPAPAEHPQPVHGLPETPPAASPPASDGSPAAGPAPPTSSSSSTALPVSPPVAAEPLPAAPLPAPALPDPPLPALPALPPVPPVAVAPPLAGP